MTNTTDSFLAIPRIGGQIFIEPGQTATEIDRWFSLLKENNMDMCRIRMFETYMHKPDNTWDFSLFDSAFTAAGKYGIRIFATVFPATPFTDVGGFKFPSSEDHLESIAMYIKNLVSHFKTFPSLYGWVLLNEPGIGAMYPDTKIPADEFTDKKFDEWKHAQGEPAYKSKGYMILDFAEERFLVDYTVWFLNWIACEIRKYDPDRHLHVNNHSIFQNVAEYDFPKWRGFLSSLGGSAHASWHYGYFKREEYAVAMAANCEIVRSGAGTLPWFITEIQGGNNTYSGYDPMCPTEEEISQWLWTIIGTGGKGGIFWCFNPRASGREAGEWAMIDFHDEPSDRVIAASCVAACIREHESLFAASQPIESGINILYTRESLWIGKNLHTNGIFCEGRTPGGMMKSCLGYFEALTGMGVQSNLKSIDEFDFSKTDYHGMVIILAHQISLPSQHWKHLEHFVHSGGRLIADGLTACYDENAHCIMKTGFPLAGLFGASIREFRFTGNLFHLKLIKPSTVLPAHWQKGVIKNDTAEVIGRDGDDITAIRKRYGEGESVWIPSLIGLGARLMGYRALTGFLFRELEACIKNLPVRYAGRIPGLLMRTLVSGDSIITVTINKSKKKINAKLMMNENRKPVLLFADKQGKVSGAKRISINPEETIVILWEKQ